MYLRVLSLLAVLTATTAVSPAQVIKGEWTLGRSTEAGPLGNPSKVRLSLQSSRDGGDHFSSSSDWNADDLHGLDLSNTARHDVRFTVSRDAGQLECNGFLKDGEGAGLFTFNPNPQYSAQMSAAGFPGVTADRQFAFALHDVSLSFAQEMKSLGIQELDADKLIAFRIHRVTPDFVRDLRASGIDVTDANKFIAFRIHGVSPEFVRDLQRLGYANPDPNQLIALRIHRVTPEYIESLRSHGMRDLTLDQLIALRIQGIN